MSFTVKSLFRDPFVHFIILGSVVFTVFSSVNNDDTEGKTIVVSTMDVARLVSQWQTQYSRPPTKEQTAAIVDQFVQQEILYREARKLNLGEDDVIIRRRMVQKYQFLSEDMLEVPVPTDAQLSAFFEANKTRYIISPKTSFYHIYFGEDFNRGSDELLKAEDKALRTISKLNSSSAEENQWRDYGDAFMLQREYAARSDQDIAELFGRAFSASLGRQVENQWVGPIQSAYGWHAVKIVGRTALHQQSLAAIKDDVFADYAADERRRVSAEFYQKTKNQYTVVLDGLAINDQSVNDKTKSGKTINGKTISGKTRNDASAGNIAEQSKSMPGSVN